MPDRIGRMPDMFKDAIDITQAARMAVYRLVPPVEVRFQTKKGWVVVRLGPFQPCVCLPPWAL